MSAGRAGPRRKHGAIQVELDDEVVQYPWPDTETTIDDSSVSQGEHTVRVRAVNRFGPGAWSAPPTFSTEPSGPVTDLAATGRLWGARLTWMPPTTPETAARYVVTRRYGVTTTRFDATDIEAGRNYTFAVYAIDSEGQVSGGAATQLAGTRTRVRDAAMRTGLTVTIRGRVVDKTGSGVPGARVLIQRAPTSDPSSFTSVVVSTTTDADGSYRMALTPRRDFVYRVATPGTVGFGPSWGATLG